MTYTTQKRPAVLITGGSRGIGAAAARRFARGGWDVAVNYCRSRAQAEELVRELEALGVRAAALQGDVSRREEALAAVRRALALEPENERFRQNEALLAGNSVLDTGNIS